MSPPRTPLDAMSGAVSRAMHSVDLQSVPWDASIQTALDYLSAAGWQLAPPGSRVVRYDVVHDDPSPSQAVGAWCNGNHDGAMCGQFVPLNQFDPPSEPYLVVDNRAGARIYGPDDVDQVAAQIETALIETLGGLHGVPFEAARIAARVVCGGDDA